MQVSYRWLKSLVPIEWDARELADRMTFAGLSVEQVEYLDKGLSNIVVALVEAVEDHPTKAKLHVCQVNDGTETLTIVCGAPNVRAGIKVPLAKLGATLPGGFTIGAADKAGVTSYGMLCSAEELGLPEGLATAASEGGIFILPEECQIGEDIVTALWLDDAILDFELTPNRADCHSVINLAREVAALSGKPLQMPAITLPEGEGDVADMAKIEVRDADLCPRFTARVIRDLTIGESPYWLRHRLATSGIRSINSVVDISNYVLLEMNQPSHTFDYDNLAGHHIIVRRAEAGEKLVTLDETERTLNDSMLLICDEDRPVSIAGVMGGMDTEIEATTKNILIECAYFYPKSIRTTSRTLGLASEAAARYEKGIDLYNVPTASDRLVQLICQYCGGTYVRGILDSGNNVYAAPTVELRYERTRATLGVEIGDSDIERIMQALQLEYKKSAAGLLVTVPPYRPDISREEDLIEEVARLWGYDKVPATLPAGKMTEGKKTPAQKVEDKTKAVLVAAGFAEIISYSFMNPAHYDHIRLAADDARRESVKLMNPFSDEQAIMRTLLLPSMLTAAALNMKRKSHDLALFELAHVFKPLAGEKLPRETAHLCLLAAGEASFGWTGRKQHRDFFWLKGVLEELFAKLHIADWTIDATAPEPFLHPGRCCNIYVDGEYLGYLGELHPLVQANYDLPLRACLCELNFELLVAKTGPAVQYQAVSKYPAVELDLALVAPQAVTAAAVEAILYRTGGQHLQKVELFDIYVGDQLGEGKKSLAYHLLFRDLARTLTADEINRYIEDMKECLKNELAVVLRS